MAVNVILLDSTDGGGSELTLDASGTQAGDLVVVVLDRDWGGVENVTPCLNSACGDGTPEAAWTAVPRAAAGDHATRMLYRIALGGDTTYAVNLGSGSDGSAFLIAFRPTAGETLSVSDAEIVGVTGDPSTSLVAPSVDAAAAGSILLNYWKLCSSNDSGRSITEPGGTSLVDDHRSGGTWDMRSIRYETGVGSGATGTRTATASHSHDWFAASLVVEVEGGEPGDDEPLPTPTGFTFVATTNQREVTATWDPVTGADHYQLEVEEQDGVSWVPFTLVDPATSPTVLDDTDGIEWATTYRARVRAMPA